MTCNNCQHNPNKNNLSKGSCNNIANERLYGKCVSNWYSCNLHKEKIMNKPLIVNNTTRQALIGRAMAFIEKIDFTGEAKRATFYMMKDDYLPNMMECLDDLEITLPYQIDDIVFLQETM